MQTNPAKQQIRKLNNNQNAKPKLTTKQNHHQPPKRKSTKQTNQSAKQT